MMVQRIFVETHWAKQGYVCGLSFKKYLTLENMLLVEVVLMKFNANFLLSMNMELIMNTIMRFEIFITSTFTPNAVSNYP